MRLRKLVALLAGASALYVGFSAWFAWEVSVSASRLAMGRPYCLQVPASGRYS